MSSEESLKEFLEKRKINISELEKGEQDKFDLDGIEAKRIEDARMSNFPLTVEEIEKVTVAVEYNGMFAFFNNCFDI